MLKRIGEILADDSSRKRLLNAISRWTRRLFGGLATGYAVLLLLLMLAFHWIGERNLSIAFLLFLPRSIFLVPGAVLFFASILFHRLSALVVLLSAVVFLFGAMGFRLSGVPSPTNGVPGESLNVLTYNRGEHANQSLQPFKNLTRPDLLILQESGSRSAGYLSSEGYEEFVHGTDVGEFTLLSRYPILESGPVSLAGDPVNAAPAAARFVIDFAGKPITVFAVHTLSPRDTLNYYRRGAFLYGLIGIPGSPFASKRKANQAFWDQRIEQARQLRRVFESEDLPTLIVGDFNAPAGGYVHSLFRQRFEDAHAETGHGFGYSFPGTTRNPLSLGGPWMRIDYLFCDEHWKTNWCITEPDRPSQHRAVSAQFTLKP